MCYHVGYACVIVWDSFSLYLFFFKQKTAYEMRISDWSSDVCSSDLLETVAARMGWTIVAVHADEGISGTKGREKRPGLDALMKSVARRDVDVVMAWRSEERRVGKECVRTCRYRW